MLKDVFLNAEKAEQKLHQHHHHIIYTNTIIIVIVITRNKVFHLL